MLRLNRFDGRALDAAIEAAREAPLASPVLLTLEGGLTGAPPFGFVHDDTRTKLGYGENVFRAAREGLRRWAQFDLGWVRVANGCPAICTGELVAVEAHTAMFWSMNMSRITETADTPERFGFLYTTTANHVEEGQERFILEYDAEGGCVSYRIEAVSRPRHVLVRLGYPFTRAMQHRFARDSHRRMVKLAG